MFMIQHAQKKKLGLGVQLLQHKGFWRNLFRKKENENKRIEQWLFQLGGDTKYLLACENPLQYLGSMSEIV